MATAKTTFAGSTNPFTGQPINPQKAKSVRVKVAVHDLEITDDQPMARRTSGHTKYAPIFAKLKVGKCIACAPQDVGRIAKALDKHIKTLPNADAFKVRTTKRYPNDDRGRVWLLKA